MIRLFKRKFISKKNENYIKTNNHKEKLINKIFNYYERTIGRTFKPDFWGPIPPQLLKKYNINYRIGDFTSLPFEDRKFDVVTCVSVLEHMPFEDQIKGLKEMARVVKNNGQLIITYDKHKEDLTSRFINESGMTINDLVYFKKPKEVYNQNEPDIIGISLIKK